MCKILKIQRALIGALLLSLFVAVLSISVSAGTGTLSAHYIPANTKMYYYSGDGYYVNANKNVSIMINFNRLITYSVGHKYLTTGSDTPISTIYDGSNTTEWKVYNTGKYYLYAKNHDSSRVYVESGATAWNLG